MLRFKWRSAAELFGELIDQVAWFSHEHDVARAYIAWRIQPHIHGHTNTHTKQHLMNAVTVRWDQWSDSSRDANWSSQNDFCMLVILGSNPSLRPVQWCFVVYRQHCITKYKEREQSLVNVATSNICLHHKRLTVFNHSAALKQPWQPFTVSTENRSKYNYDKW